VISVIVPVRNGLPYLEEQLSALEMQECTEPWEVVVADNGSTDATASVVRGWADRNGLFRLVDASEVRGPGAARNAGVRAAKGDLLVFCDADDVVQPGWLNAHVAALTESAIVGGVFDSWSLNGLAAPSPLTHSIPSALSQFGFLPAVISDLSWRLQLRGYTCVVRTDAVVARRARQGFWGTFGRFTAYGRCGPALYRRYRAEGLQRNLALAAKTWAWLALNAPRLVRTEFRTEWASIAGWRTGRLLESWRQWTFFP
jgi:glycosyltransferase involved in cell wall biosynthesis